MNKRFERFGSDVQRRIRELRDERSGRRRIERHRRPRRNDP